MTDPIAAKAEALWAKRPELRPAGVNTLQYTARGWRLTYYGFVSDDLAHMLIEAACVRWLTARGNSIVWAQEGPITTEALIAACMEAGQ